ncbi:Holliday junction resolvase RuvX [Arthrobacter cryoconiti]|uniref:Holliday junction resolvase RuvX n=1 Tax=Arthrobacter cryoconiti TaxID=748907 RepID=UPI002DD7B183|nr:Holliday junction resolvase RuvX [Arthrobacter cryoconiti]
MKLGVDVGMVRVGLAACDPDGILATPVKTLTRDAKRNSDIRLVAKEAGTRNAVEVFVGLPRTLKGAEKASAEMARGYAALLVTELARVGLDTPVRLIDERLTTVSAHQALHAAGLDGREHRKVVDQAAAVGILQHALDMQKGKNGIVGELVPADVATVPGDGAHSRTEEGLAITTEALTPRTPWSAS